MHRNPSRHQQIETVESLELRLDAVEGVFRTNFLGSVAVTHAMLPLLRKALAARLVNLSRGLGSLTQNGDPRHKFPATTLLDYKASKRRSTCFTGQLAYEIRDTSIKVNSADPGLTATDLYGHLGRQTILEGSAEAARLALLPDDGTTGTYSDGKSEPPTKDSVTTRRRWDSVSRKPSPSTDLWPSNQTSGQPKQP